MLCSMEKNTQIPGREMANGAAHSAAQDAIHEETITLGGGCFWCTEAVFDQVKGVKRVDSGYAGGRIPNPTYEQVCSGMSGHAEVIRVSFDPAEISLDDVLRIFFTVHDPTTLNRQGADAGTQYRSVILYNTEAQKATAERVIREINAGKIWDNPIVTELAPAGEFYTAEGYHQEYYANNSNQPYCRIVIAPKVKKFREHFRDRMRV